MTESRLSPLSGVVFAITIVGALALIRNFSFVPPPDEAVAFFAGHSRSIVIGTYVGALGGFFLLWFGGSLMSWLRAAEGASGSGRLPAIALAGAASAALALTAGFVVLAAGAERFSEGGGIGPDGATTIFDLSGAVAGNVAPYGFAAMMAASALVAWRTRLLPRWAVWATAVGALGLLTPVNWALLEIPVLWIAAVSIHLSLTSARRHSPGDPTGLSQTSEGATR